MSRGKRKGSPRPLISVFWTGAAAFYSSSSSIDLNWVDPVPDPLLLRKSGSAGNRTRDLCIRSQTLWPLDHRGGLQASKQYIKIFITVKRLVISHIMIWNLINCVWNVTAHAQKPDYFFRWDGRVHLNWQGRKFSRLLAADLCASAVIMLDTPCSEVVWRVLATHSIRQFPLHFPSRASQCAITLELDSTQSHSQINILKFYIYCAESSGY